MESKLEPVGENEATKAPSLFSKDGTRESDRRLEEAVVNIGQAHHRRDSSRLTNRRDSTGSRHGARPSSAPGGGLAGSRGFSESSHSSWSTSRRISAVGTIFESPHIAVGTQLVLVAPAFLYAIAVVMWLFQGQDIEFARELAPVSFAALCVHLFAAGEIPYLTFWEVVHYWFHAACEVLVANDYTRKIGGGVSGVFLTSVLMLLFWPTGWVMLRRLRVKLIHPSRTSRFPNVGESAMNSGVPLVCLSLYLGTQSLSCLVYEGVTDCALKNSGTRHLNYSLGTLYVLWMLFRHVTGSTAKQVMLFRLRHHQSYAVVFSFLSTMYSLYEYAAQGIPYRNNASELMADLIIFLCWFLSIVTIINAAPREHTPVIMYLSTVIPDTTLQIESLEVAPDGAFTEKDRKRLSLGPLSKDRGPLGRMLRETSRPLSTSQRGSFEGAIGLGASSPGESNYSSQRVNWMERSGSLYGDMTADNNGDDDGDGDGDGDDIGDGAYESTSNNNNSSSAPFGTRRSPTASLFNRESTTPETEAESRRSLGSSAGQRSASNLDSYEEIATMAADSSRRDASDEDADGDSEGSTDQPQVRTHPLLRWMETEDYTHPLLKYYRMHGRIPPLTFFTTYLCEIVFFWRFMLFTFTVGYKLFLSLAAYLFMNRHWAQIFTPLSTSALTVSWLLTLGCDPRDRISNQMMNVHFWFHALSEIPDVIVWFKNGQNIEVIFNVLIIVIVWPWVYFAYRRVLTTLRAKYRGQEEDTSVKLFWEGSFLMAVEFYLAFQANGCLVHASPGQEDSCDNIIHSNLISGLNIILIFLVVRVMLFKLGDLTITRTLHLELRPYEILVVIFSVVSGLVSLYFLANREDGITKISGVRQGLEWTTMFLWIVVCLVMAHLTPAVDSVRAKALAELVMTRQVVGPNEGEPTAGTNGTQALAPTSIPPGLDQATDDLALAMAASRRKASRATGVSKSPPRGSSPTPSGNRSRDKGPVSLTTPHTASNEEGVAHEADGSGTTGASNGGLSNGDSGNPEMAMVAATPTDMEGGNGVDGLPEEEHPEDDSVKDVGSRCCCPCWDSFAFWMDQRNTQNNLPVFRLLYFSSTLVYFAVMLGVAAGGIKRGYATAVVGVSFASVCSHWLISIEHPTSTMEAVHLLLHASTEAISVLLWVSTSNWTQAVYTLCSFFAVYPCLFYGIQALKLGLHRKFSDHLALVREAMKIFLRSSVLLMVLMYLAFECIGCLNARSEGDCTALLYANTQVGLSVVLGFLSFLGLIVMQDITSRHFLQLSFTWPQVAVLAFSLVAVGLCIFSLASRHFNKLTTDIWEHMVELVTVFSWYAALLILWIRRPWYDTTWGENDSLDEEDEEVVEGEESEMWRGIEGDDAPNGEGSPTPDWTEMPEKSGTPADLV